MPEEIDVENMSAEDRESALDELASDEYEDSTEEPEPSDDTTSESEETDTEEREGETEGTEAASTEEVETSEEQPAEEPEEQPEKLYAGKYKSPEDLEKAYLETSAESSRMAQELAKRTKEESEEPASPEEETTPADEEFSVDTEKYNEIMFDKGEVAANAWLFGQMQQHSQQQALEQRVTAEAKEAESYNQRLGQERARELLYEKAKEEGDRAAMEKFKKGASVTAKDLEKYPDVTNQFLAEFEYIENTFKRNDLKVGDEVLKNQGKYADDVYRKAYIQLNHDKIVEQTRVSAAEQTVDDIKKAKPGVTTVTSRSTTKSGNEVKWSGHENVDQATRKASKMSPDDRERLLDEW